MCATCQPGQKARVPASWRPTVVELTNTYLYTAGYTEEMCDGCRYRLYVWLRGRGLPSLMDAAVAVWLQFNGARRLRHEVGEQRRALEKQVAARS